ncbi:hypothetical protein AVEN_262811-1 [Araneus ventricosus]|uniref:Uncharacterized protein n=1 Tax=Araneus ventricosus TaxID=182803 RepID=A0A4Y2TLV5_ARAVE|nr:hypothetical protein AVEN_262811-1 [Araneus ventricosus]
MVKSLQRGRAYNNKGFCTGMYGRKLPVLAQTQEINLKGNVNCFSTVSLRTLFQQQFLQFLLEIAFTNINAGLVASMECSASIFERIPLRTPLLEYSSCLRVCQESMAPLIMYEDHFTDTVKHVLLLIDTVLRYYCKICCKGAVVVDAASNTF